MTTNMTTRKRRIIKNICNGYSLFFLLSLFSVWAFAEVGSNVSINGQRLSQGQLQVLERQLGYQVTPGSYLYNPYNGCWKNLNTGQMGCHGYNAGSNNGSSSWAYGSGSGEWNSRGDWSHYDDYGGAVGGSSDGCIYTATWSNC